MVTTQIDALDTTIHKTNTWLKEIMEELHTEDRHRAFLALRAVLQTLRNRMTLEETAEFSAQLPVLIRGLFFEGWEPSKQPVKYDLNNFLNAIREHFTAEPKIDGEFIARGVFRVLSRRVAQGEIKDIKSILPQDMRRLWE